MLQCCFPSRRLISIPNNYLHSLDFSRPTISRRCFSDSQNTQIEPDQFSKTHHELLNYFDHLLRICRSFQQSKQIHTQIVLYGGSSSSFLASRLISVYSSFELLTDARKVFKSVPINFLSNVLLWNTMLRANITHGECLETLKLYVQMRNLGVWPDGFSFPLVIRACAMMGHPKFYKLVHCHVSQMGFQNNRHVVNELLAAYGKLGQMGIARQLFDRMVVRSYISWNTMVSGFAFNYDCGGALEIFKRMEVEGWEPNLVTWTSLLSSHARCGCHRETLQLYDVMRSKDIGATAESLAVVISVCADSDAFDKGKEIHGYVVRAGFENYVFVKNSLVCLYGKHGVVIAAEYLFSEIKVKSIVSWNALIASYAESGFCDEALATLLKLESSDGCPKVRPNLTSWSAVISGFASKGRFEESLELFRKMQLTKVIPTSITISSILSVCAELSAIVLGKEIHAHLIRGLMDRNVLVGNGLINMYTKCGSLKEGHLAFKKIDDRDLYSWNTMIKGYGMHGLGAIALKTFNQMINVGYKPDGVTFVSVLSACSHAGLVNEGRKLFNQMKTEFRIEPEVEHYACMVDLLGRAGLLQEASDIVKSMPMEANAFVWGSLLNSCRMHKDTDVAEEYRSFIDSAMTGSGTYMLLSNIYAASGRWEDSARVRISARTMGLKKIPGQSWIELKKTVHMFSAGNLVKSGMEEVHKMLNILSVQMEMEGYAAHKKSGLQNTDVS